jgi:hypothetical protein
LNDRPGRHDDGRRGGGLDEAFRKELRSKTQGRRPQIPAFRLNRQMVRFHPRTIISKLADDAGVKFEVIAASFGEIK